MRSRPRRPTTHGATPETAGGLTSRTPFGFAGGYTDPTGLVYLIHRYYDPASGQFLSVDPEVGQTNAPYGYAAGNPTTVIDPSGLDEICGNCGCSWLRMFNRSGGYCLFAYGFESDRGAVIYRNVHYTWWNERHGNWGTHADEHWMDSHYYANTHTSYTKNGWVFGELWGGVLLWWGGVCFIDYPISIEYVTWR